MYGLYVKDGKFYIGNKLYIIVDNDLVVGKDEYEEYEGTFGLWELIVSKEPKDFTKEDYENYAKLMVKTNTLYRENNPENKRPKAVKVINGIIYLKTFGIIVESIRERESLLFRVTLMRC